MNWAFWRKPPAEGRETARLAERAVDDSDPGRTDPAQALRVRARRRLIGAAALLLAAVIVVPMVLDPAPRPVPDTVSIDIPSEKTPFSPRLPLPPVPDPAQGAAESAPESGKPDEARKAADAKPTSEQKAPEPAAAKAVEKAKDEPAPKTADTAAEKSAKAAEAQRARDILEGKSAAKPTVEGKFLVQAAAPRSEQAASELAAKLKKAGLPSFTERVQASDGARWRVRVGPYATRQEAERARVRLRELGTGADLITP